MHFFRISEYLVESAANTYLYSINKGAKLGGATGETVVFMPRPETIHICASLFVPCPEVLHIHAPSLFSPVWRQ